MVRKHTIKCSACKETFSEGFDYRMHWEEFHLDYAMEQVKIKMMSIQIEEYVRQTYKQRFKDKPVLITENDACFIVTHHEDASPIILSKTQWRTY